MINPYQPGGLALNDRILSDNLELTFQNLEALIDKKQYDRYFPLFDYMSIRNTLSDFLNNRDNIKIGDRASFLLDDGTFINKEVIGLWCERTRIIFLTKEYLIGDVYFIGKIERWK